MNRDVTLSDADRETIENAADLDRFEVTIGREAPAFELGSDTFAFMVTDRSAGEVIASSGKYMTREAAGVAALKAIARDMTLETVTADRLAESLLSPKS